MVTAPPLPSETWKSNSHVHQLKHAPISLRSLTQPLVHLHHRMQRQDLHYHLGGLGPRSSDPSSDRRQASSAKLGAAA